MHKEAIWSCDNIILTYFHFLVPKSLHITFGKKRSSDFCLNALKLDLENVLCCITANAYMHCTAIFFGSKNKTHFSDTFLMSFKMEMLGTL